MKIEVNIDDVIIALQEKGYLVYADDEEATGDILKKMSDYDIEDEFNSRGLVQEYDHHMPDEEMIESLLFSGHNVINDKLKDLLNNLMNEYIVKKKVSEDILAEIFRLGINREL